MDQLLNFLEPVWNFIIQVGQVILSLWWLIIPIFLIALALYLWRLHKEEEYKSNIDWTMIEVRVPKEIEKSPKAMEQIFAAAHAINTKVKTKDKWLKGKVGDWITFELIGRAGKIHFLIRTPSEYRNLVESAIYSQYSEAEISIVPEEDDYIHEFPNPLPNKTYDIAGAELKLKKDDGYPIRTWEYFEERDEEKRLDPISSIMETMSDLKPSEAIWIQLILQPAGDDWVEEGEKLADKLWQGKKDKSSKLPEPFKTLSEWADAIAEFIRNFFIAFFQLPAWGEGRDEDDDKKSNLSPGKRKVVEAIEDKISKLGFKGALRVLYIDRKDEFTTSNVTSIQGALRQFDTNNLNKFEANKGAMEGHKLLLTKDNKKFQGKRKFYSNFITRDFPDNTSVFNVEELATLYHFPLTDIKSPELQKTSFKKGGPPSDLPTVEDEE